MSRAVARQSYAARFSGCALVALLDLCSEGIVFSKTRPHRRFVKVHADQERLLVMWGRPLRR